MKIIAKLLLQNIKNLRLQEQFRLGMIHMRTSPLSSKATQTTSSGNVLEAIVSLGQTQTLFKKLCSAGKFKKKVGKSIVYKWPKNL